MRMMRNYAESLGRIVLLAIAMAFLGIFALSSLLWLGNGFHPLALLFGTLHAIVSIAALVWVNSRMRILIKHFKMQRKVMETGNVGIAIFLSKKWGGVGKVGWALLPDSLYKITYSYRDENGEERVVTTRRIYKEDEAFGFEERGTIPIRFIGEHSEIVQPY